MLNFRKCFFAIIFINFGSIFQTDAKQLSMVEVMQNATLTFIYQFLDTTNSTFNETCILTSYLPWIYNYYSSEQNNLENYSDCLWNDMNYYFLLLIDKNYTQARGNQLSFYFKDLIFQNYISFSLCLPNCINVSDNILVNITEFIPYNEIILEGDMFILRTFHMTEPHNFLTYYNLIILIIIFSFFFTVSSCFSIFPNYEHISFRNWCLRKKFDLVQNSGTCLSENMSNEESENERIENEKRYKIRRERYKFFSSIFNFSKNINRFFKKADQHSCYSNDHSLGFINGLKGINLFLLTFSAIFWTIIELPTSNMNFITFRKKAFNTYIFLPLLNFLYVSLFINYSFSGFQLSYKLLSCLNKYDNENKNSFKNKLIYFLLPLISRYLFYLVLFLLVNNINVILGTLLIKKGPLMSIFGDSAQISLKNIIYFIIPVANFISDQEFRSGSLMIYFFMFIAEFYYFLVCFILLLIYYKKPKLGIRLLVCFFFFTILLRTVIFTIYDRDLRDIFGFDVYLFNLQNGFPIYVMGTIFGVFYFEYNCHTPKLIFSRNEIDQTYHFFDIDDSMNFRNEKDKSIHMISHHPNETLKMKHLFDVYSPVKRFINHVSKSNLIQNLSIIIIFLIICFFSFYDYFVLFEKINADVLYKFNIFEKIYIFLELEFISFFIFAIVFKFVIFKNSSLKIFLESHNWILFSKSFIVVVALISPITYFVILSQDCPVIFEYFYSLCLAISILSLSLFFSWGIILIIEIPIRVGLKKIIRECMSGKLKEN